jgi:hypothetical protein
MNAPRGCKDQLLSGRRFIAIEGERGDGGCVARQCGGGGHGESSGLCGVAVSVSLVLHVLCLWRGLLH